MGSHWLEAVKVPEEFLDVVAETSLATAGDQTPTVHPAGRHYSKAENTLSRITSQVYHSQEMTGESQDHG